MSPETMQPPTRAERLRSATNSTHERLDHTIMAARPFENVANYARFLQVQFAFHRDVAGLYTDPALGAQIEGLPGLSRHEAVARDAASLGADLSPVTDAPATEGMALPEALGWLYVVEGSNLGAAFLYKAALKMGLSAEHGAAHLAEAPEGRAAHWRNFKSALNAISLTAEEEERVIAGANAAFARVRAHVARFLPQPELA